MNDYLTASNANLNTVLDTTLDKLRGATIEGNDLILTLRPGAAEARVRAAGRPLRLGRRARPKTGRVLVMASRPLRPEPDGQAGRLREDPQDPGALLVAVAAREPGDLRPLHPGLDLQGRDHHRPRSTPASITPESTLRRPGLLRRVRAQGDELLATRAGRPSSAASTSSRRSSTRSTRSSATSARRWGRSRSSTT